MGSAPSYRATDAARPGVALQPVIDIIDHVDLGYEALPRPAETGADDAVVGAALALAQHTGPALLLVPLHHGAFTGAGVDLTADARRAGVNPGEVAWIVRTEAGRALDDIAIARLRELRGAGFLLAVDAVTPALDRRFIADLRPDFVFLDPGLPRRVIDDDVAKAELAATVVFVARLDGRIVARGVDSKTTAAAVAELGVQYGVGPHLARPLVVDPSVAEPGDELVTSASFQRREVRIFRERGDTLRAPIELTTLAPPGATNLDDRTFARFLVETARTLQAEHDPDRILKIAATRLNEVAAADRLAIFEADWEHHRFRPRVLAGEGTEGLTSGEISLSEGITGWAFARAQPYRCADTDSHPAAATIPGTRREPESMLAIPLIAGDQRLGVIDIWRNGIDRFSEEDLERCALLGFVTSAALSNAQMYVELERRALTDALTGLFNIRWWRDMAPRVMSQSLRTGAGVGILLMDLDHFKEINDTAGHAVGDSVLRAVARALRRVVRDSDYAVRYGGEEFLVVLTNSNVDGALRVAQALHEAVSELRAPTSAPTRVTASIGVAVFPDHGQELDDVVLAADQAMYQAKRDGRDRISIAPDPRG